MRRALVLLVLATAACASGSAPTRTTGQTMDRRTTSVSIPGTGGDVSVNVETSAILETKAFSISGPRDAVWPALALAYQDVGIPLATYDTVQYYIGNPGLLVSNGRLGRQRMSRYLNCGSDPLTGQLADRYDVRLTVVSRVRPEGEGTLLETQVSGSATQRGVSSMAVPCASTGSLEEAIASATRLRLVGGHPND